MPYAIEQEGDKWKVVNSDTGDVKGEHDTEEEAKAQLAALYVHADDTDKSVTGGKLAKDMAMDGSPGTMFIPITKLDVEKQEVYGWGALEQPDASNEIMDYATSKPHFVEWSGAAAKRSGGKSLGNVRAMHQTKAAGKLVDFKSDDMNKGFYVGAKIVDQGEWEKVKEGVYTGFSIGGSYLRRWPDTQIMGKIRYTAKPTELSLVDAPCIPGATFQIMKADSIETGTFKSGGASGLHVPIMVVDLEKLDDTPVPTPEPDLGCKVGDMTVQHMPPPNATLEVPTPKAPNDAAVPGTGQLTAATAKTVDLQEFTNSILKQFRTEVRKIIREELYKAIGEEPDNVQDKSDGGSNKRMIKVERR